MPRSPNQSDGGSALIALLALLTAGSLYFIVGQLDTVAVQRKRDETTMRALAQAKDALIAWSINQADVTGGRPGELPCPDTDAPGTTGYGKQEGSCAAGKIGRLPWKTLGIEELVDGSGEPLWYAIDGNFRKSTALINSDNRATQLAYLPDGTTTITTDGNEAAAVIFAPGHALSGQVRGTISQQEDPVNYLDSAMAFTNSNSGGPYIQGTIRDNAGNILLNDRLIALTARELISAAEIRVIPFVRLMLNSYFTDNIAYYPYPAKYDDSPSCLDSNIITYCNSDKTQCRGRLPQVASMVAPSLNDWPEIPTSPGNPTMPAWFSANLWGQVLYYAVDSDFLKSSTITCKPKVNGIGVKVVVLFPGATIGTTNRRPAAGQSKNLTEYFEDAENQDGWSVGANDNYVRPGSSGSPSNDHILVIP